jgi:hypothetical protein
VAEQLNREQRLEQALRDLIRSYVCVLENGRDRILMLGGDCDPVDVMERGNPYLNKAKAALAYGVPPTHVPSGFIESESQWRKRLTTLPDAVVKSCDWPNEQQRFEASALFEGRARAPERFPGQPWRYTGDFDQWLWKGWLARAGVQVPTGVLVPPVEASDEAQP